MLNSETKRHIDAARDVLVGVAPNPTTQIDQITYALIYKFMDDMDQSAIKAGGKPSFFTDDLEPYAWSRLMDSRMGNQEKMNMYGEALTKFSEAKQLPELFRTIFKAAFLPYRSPETLGLFLKEISYFDYSHPEELGNAYEYLLSIMSSQGDAGQFRTPRHIIDFIVDVINPTKDDKVLDPACGTAGFLVSTYNHILEQHDGKDDPKKNEKPLTPDERKKLMQNLQGYDIDPTMVRIAQVNMYLHQFKNPQIFQYDSLTSEERWSEKFDVILANPPFMTPKGGIKPHDKFSVPSNRAEVLFVDYIINHLRPKGRAGIIVPEGIIFQSGKAYKALRKNLIENGLYAVVSLPGGVFQPYSGVKTSILLIDNEIAKQKSEIAFIKISADGYDLGATKRKVSQNDLPLALESLKAWANGKSIENEIFTLVNKVEIAEKGGYNLSGERYVIATDYSHSRWNLMSLESITSVIANGMNYKNDKSSGGIPISRIQTISHGVINFELVGYADIHSVESKHLLQPGDILFSHINSIDHLGKVAIYNSNMKPLIHGMNLLRITADTERVKPEYLCYLLRSSLFRERVRAYAKQAVNQASISIEDLKTIEIPLPPREFQEEIVAELDGYAAIISGAKQIVENWKPRIDVDPSWPIYRLGDLCELITKGTTPTTEGFNFEDSGVNFLKVESISEGGELLPSKFAFISPECHNKLKRSHLKSKDVLFSIAGALGRTAVVSQSALPANINQNIAIIRLKPDLEIDPQFLQYSLGTDSAKKQSEKYQAGIAQQVISLGQLGSYLLAIPSQEIQTQIIESVKQEKNLIRSAMTLIETFESRTQAIIAKLWSE